MAFQLVVKHPFDIYNIGDHITDPDQVARWQTSHPEFVVRKDLPDPEPVVEPPVSVAPVPYKAAPAPAPEANRE